MGIFSFAMFGGTFLKTFEKALVKSDLKQQANSWKWAVAAINSTSDKYRNNSGNKSHSDSFPSCFKNAQLG